MRDRDGLDVTEQYKVSYVEGKLVIGKRPVEVAGEGWIEPQPYKGEEYVKSGYAAELPSGFSEMQPGGTRGLVGGQSIEAAYRLAGADARLLYRHLLGDADGERMPRATSDRQLRHFHQTGHAEDRAVGDAARHHGRHHVVENTTGSRMLTAPTPSRTAACR